MLPDVFGRLSPLPRPPTPHRILCRGSIGPAPIIGPRPIAAWHSLTSDVSQQEMLRSVAKQGPSLVITNVQPFPWNGLIVNGIAETASVGGLIASSATHQLRQLGDVRRDAPGFPVI